jgi:hypothetical protein
VEQEQKRILSRREFSREKKCIEHESENYGKVNAGEDRRKLGKRRIARWG